MGEGSFRYFPLLPACIYTVIFSFQEHSKQLCEIKEDLEKRETLKRAGTEVSSLYFILLATVSGNGMVINKTTKNWFTFLLWKSWHCLD